MALASVLLNAPRVAAALELLFTELNRLALLGLLALLPEQADAKIVPYNRRDAAAADLKAISSRVLEILEASSASGERTQQAKGEIKFSLGLRAAALPGLVAWTKHGLLPATSLQACRLVWECLDKLNQASAQDIDLQVVLQAIKAAEAEEEVLLLFVSRSLSLAQRLPAVQKVPLRSPYSFGTGIPI